MRVLAFISAAALAAGLLVGGAASAYADPAVGDCLDMPVGGDPFDPLKASTVVDCEAPHNGEVFGLGDYPSDWGKPSDERERLDDFGWLFQTCSFQMLNEYKESAGAEPTMINDRLFIKVSAPSDQAWEAGDRTVQCVVFALAGLPGRERMTAWTGTIPDKMKTSVGLREFARCTPAKPKSGVDNAIAQCKGAKNWIGVTRVFNLKGTPAAKFPGPAIQKDADARCARAAKGFIKGKKVKPFGAVEPKEMWDDGIKEAVCYIPLKNWNGKGAA
jgi:hypothetical protein